MTDSVNQPVFTRESGAGTTVKQQAIARDGGLAYKSWATIGVCLMMVEGYSWFKWITGPHFTPTIPAEPMSDFFMNIALAYQIIAPILMLIAIWFWVIKPWREQGKLTTDGMLAICLTTICFYDPTFNYASTSLFYNSHYVNFGAWTSSIPGWMSPRGHVLPEPLLVVVPGYLVAVFGQAVFVLWVLRKFKAMRPNTGAFTMALLIILSLFFVDTVLEIILIQSRVYMYPGAIHALTLWPGEWYQFPLTEGLFFGGFGIGVCGLLMYFKDDKGETFADRGLEKTHYSPFKKQLLKFAALFGCTHFGFLMLYTGPSAFVALHSDSFPQERPAYFENGMCVYGIEENRCPGPGVMMPRPTEQFFNPQFENQK